MSYVNVCVYVQTYIYIYIEREREIYRYIYIYIYICPRKSPSRFVNASAAPALGEACPLGKAVAAGFANPSQSVSCSNCKLSPGSRRGSRPGSRRGSRPRSRRGSRPRSRRGSRLIWQNLVSYHDVLCHIWYHMMTYVVIQQHVVWYDASWCRHPTLSCPSIGSWSAVFYSTWWTWRSEKW